jgi:two-component system, NarL family, sensor kinase
MHDRASKIIAIIFILATFLVLLLLGFVLIILSLHRKRQQKFIIDLENVKTNFEKESLKTQLEMQEQTFQYISQEIHDNIGQFISLAKLHLNTLDFSNLAAVKEQISHSADLLTKALDDLRDLSKSLSSEIIRSNGLATAIEMQIAQLKKLELPQVVYEVAGEYQFMDEQKEIFILRIFQEATNNILRHSEARRITILLTYNQNNFALSIADNGKGFDKFMNSDHKTSGIRNMTKRAKMIGADFAIESSMGAGTVVHLSVPY